MKVLLILLTVSMVSFAAEGYSQARSFTFQLKDVSLLEVFEQIESQSDIQVAYDVSAIDVNRKMNIDVSGEPVEKVLRKALENTDLSFKVMNRYVIITKGNDMDGTGTQQLLSISGIVSDTSGASLPGVTVVLKGTNNGTVTDISGNYSLGKIPTDGTLIFSFVGMETQEVQVAGKTNINIVLKDEAIGVDEVVVVGYSVQKKSTLTGAVSPINVDNMKSRRVSELSQALQGQVAGVQVTQSTGAPGDEINIRIRGEGTIGDNNPLYVIDGVPSRELSFINPSDIQSMTVLKDASAAAVYGSRAASGVVIITTKSGKKGRSQFDIDYFRGVQTAVNLPDMLNAEQYMNVVEQAWNNSGYSGTNPYTVDKGRADFADTDWLDEVFEAGFSQNVQMTASGGSDKLQYLLSVGYYDQDGIVVYDNDKYQRYNFRTNINADLTDRIKIGTNLQLSYAIQDKLSSKGDKPGIIRHALLRPPVLSVYKDKSNPTYSEDDPFTDLPFYTINETTGKPEWESKSKYEETANPVALAYFTDDKRSHFKTFGNLYGQLAFLQDKSLTFKTNVGIDLNFTHNKAFAQNFGDDDGNGNDLDKGKGRQNRPSSLSEDRGEEITVTWNNTLNFIKTFDKHSINALAGSEFIRNYASGLSASRARYEYDSDKFRYIDSGSTEQDLWNGGSGSEWALLSFFTSATYVYNSKYMLTANVRADASSRFGENNHWGYFPSVSVGWKLSEESFMEQYDWLSDLKLRVSVGQLGNQEIPNYSYLTLIRKVGDQYEISRYGNPDMKWEATTQYNYGVDLGLLKNKIYFTADYFKKVTTDILLPVNLYRFVGNVGVTYVNSGEVHNSGFEFALTYKNSEHAFKYNINANLSLLKNEVVKLYPNLPNISEESSRTESHHPLNAYYGYVFDGIYQNTNEISSHLFNTNNITAVPGDIRFKDLNEDGKIDGDDRDFIGDPNPGLLYGLNFSASYRGFDFSLLFQGVGNVDRYNDSKKILDYDTRPFNYTTGILDSWNGEGSTNSRPRVSFTDNGSSRTSNVYVEDASYFRLKNVELGYTLSSINRFGLKDVRFYVSAQNVFTITDYTGLDPESVDLIDMGTYPQSRAFIGGINLTF